MSNLHDLIDNIVKDISEGYNFAKESNIKSMITLEKELSEIPKLRKQGVKITENKEKIIFQYPGYSRSIDIITPIDSILLYNYPAAKSGLINSISNNLSSDLGVKVVSCEQYQTPVNGYYHVDISYFLSKHDNNKLLPELKPKSGFCLV